MAINTDIDLERIAKALVFAGWYAREAVNARKTPEPGDLVFEYTSLHQPPYLDKVGRLIYHSRSQSKIKTLDNRILNWSNHELLVIPEGLRNN